MPKTFQEMLPSLEKRLEQARQGALPLGHALELRRREKRLAMGCPSEEEICGYVDGGLRVYSARRWAEVGWHVPRCQSCQEDVKGLCDALGFDSYGVAERKPVSNGLFRVVVPIVAVAAVLVLAVLGVQTYMPARSGAETNADTSSVENFPVNAPALVDHQLLAPPKRFAGSGVSTLKVGISPDAGVSDVSRLRVAVCSETEQPTCGEDMALMSVVAAKCKVVGDGNACSATSPAGGCAICVVSK